MAMRRRGSGRRLSYRRSARSRGIGYRYLLVGQLSPQTVNAGANQGVQLLDPAFFLSGGITKKAKIASIQGYIDVALNPTLPPCAAAGIFPLGATYALGFYVDTGVVTTGTVDDPLTQGYSTNWMWWKPGHAALSYVCAGANSPQNLADAFSFQRFYLQTRKYTRNIDPSDDSFLFCISNDSSSTSPIAVTYQLRVLLLEP